MARVGAEGKALILLVTFFPQCVVSMLSMTPPVMASQIALSLSAFRRRSPVSMSGLSTLARSSAVPSRPR